MLSRFKKCFSFTPKPEYNLNLNDILRPLYVLLSLLGLFPYSVKFKNQSFVIIPKSIYINSLCAVTMVLTLWAFVALHVQYITVTYKDNAMTDATVTHMNYICEMLALNIFCIVAYVSAFLNRFKLVNMLNMFAKWLESSKDSDKLLKSIQTKVKLIMGLLIFLFVSEILVDLTRNDTIWKIVLCNFTFIFPLMVQCICIGFYYILVCMVGAIISSITEHVKSQTKGNLAVKSFMKVECKSSLTLKQLESIYIEVFDVKQEISKAFQASMLVTAIQSFHSIVSESHIIYHGVVKQTLSIHEIVNCSLWALIQIIKIYALSDCGSLLKHKTLKLGQALYNISTEKHDLSLLAEIQHFSTLMTFYGGEITVYGLFSIDATLIFKVTASAVMYLIILVQLDDKKW